jgi:hypothetical protein
LSSSFLHPLSLSLCIHFPLLSLVILFFPSYIFAIFYLFRLLSSVLSGLFTRGWIGQGVKLAIQPPSNIEVKNGEVTHLFLLYMFFRLFSTVLLHILVGPVRHYRQLSLHCLKDTDTIAGKGLSKQHVQMSFSGRSNNSYWLPVSRDVANHVLAPQARFRESLTSHLGAKHTSPFLMGEMLDRFSIRDFSFWYDPHVGPGSQVVTSISEEFAASVLCPDGGESLRTTGVLNQKITYSSFSLQWKILFLVYVFSIYETTLYRRMAKG